LIDSYKYSDLRSKKSRRPQSHRVLSAFTHDGLVSKFIITHHWWRILTADELEVPQP